MAADADALAADIICSLRWADLAGWTPPWCKPPPTSGEGEMIWPAVARGKRSRRRSPVAAAGKGRWARDSPASPLDYSGGSGSGASTSGDEDGGFFSPGHRRAGPAPTTKVGSIGRPHLAFPAPPPRPTGQRPRKKMRLPEVQQLVRSLTVENESLREEMRALQRACTTLSKENDKLETHYVLLLCSFKEQLQQHVRVHAMEAVMGCWELEQSLQSLTGASPGEGTGATMSDDEDNQVDSETNMFDGNDGSDGMGFGPLILTEGERSLVERVRHELKSELKQGYKEKLVDIREEILRKRRAGKLPGDTASILKAWWQAHSKWPYPTEDDKARLVQETGLQLKQINNWFINQRKRNWHSNPTSSGEKTKKKRNVTGDGGAEQSW